MVSVQRKNATRIPYPEYESYLHKRIPLIPTTATQRQEFWSKQPTMVRVLEAILSRLAKFTHGFNRSYRYGLYRVVNSYFYIYFKIFNRLKVYNKDIVPKTGCIMYITHHSSMDPLIIFGCNPQYLFGSLMHWGNSWFSDVMDKYYGLIAFKDYDSRQIKVEKMIRTILTKTPFFVIAPEGLVGRDDVVRQGFSSVIDVYATINSNSDRLPFLPVLIRGGQKYRSAKPNTNPIDIHFYPPFFLPREWLKKPEYGGKTAREMVDYIMMVLARKMGQKTLAPNPRLEWQKAQSNPVRLEELKKEWEERRRKWREMEEERKKHQFFLLRWLSNILK